MVRLSCDSYGDSMRALLINSPLLFARQLSRLPFSTHLHLLYSVLRAHDVDVVVFDPTVDLGLPGGDLATYERRIRSQLNGIESDIVGVSCWTSFHYAGAMLVGRAIRENSPSTPIVVGGWHPTAVPQDFCAPESPFDWVVTGPGEKVLLDLCRRPRRPNRSTVVAGDAIPLCNIRWDWSYPYHRGGIFLARGCPHTCVYCAEHSRPLEVCDVPHAVEQYARASAASRDGFVHVHDACFGVRRSWRRAFLARIASLNLDTRLDIETRVDQLEHEDIILLAANRATVFFGVESGSEQMLRTMGKTRSPTKYLARCLATLEDCDRLGVPYWLSMMLGHPGETPSTLNDSVDFFWRILWNGPSKNLIGLAIHRYGYWPGSRMDQQLPWFERVFGTRILNPTWWRSPSQNQSELSEDVTASRTLSTMHIEEAERRLGVAQWVHRARHGPAPVPSRDELIARSIARGRPASQ